MLRCQRLNLRIQEEVDVNDTLTRDSYVAGNRKEINSVHATPFKSPAIFARCRYAWLVSEFDPPRIFLHLLIA